MTNDLAVATITSLEVAEMVEKEHNALLKDIRRYSEQMESAIEDDSKIGEVNFALTDFWAKSTYTTEQNKVLPCYIVTKKGCEFISHKLTGTKGTVFTAKYINRFHDMENALVAQANQAPTISKSKGFDWLETSKAKLPLNRNWFERNRRIIKEVADETGLLLAEVEQEIVDRVFQRYDKSLCSDNFMNECGRKPRSKKEMISYFEELSKEADKILYDLQELPF